MKKSLLASMALFGLASAAQAADAVVYQDTPFTPAYVAPATFDWSGAYIGANIGYGWGGGYLFDALRDDGLSYFSFQTVRPQGFFGGLQAGYNLQMNQFVFGIEADAQVSGIRHRYNDIVSNENAIVVGSVDHHLPWFGTLRGRVGVAVDRALIYGTGGLAWSSIRYNSLVSDGVNSVAFSDNRTGIGYALGGGVEFAVADGWSLKGEYQYIDFGRRTLTSTATTGEVFSTSYRTNAHTFRIGANYRF